MHREYFKICNLLYNHDVRIAYSGRHFYVLSFHLTGPNQTTEAVCERVAEKQTTAPLGTNQEPKSNSPVLDANYDTKNRHADKNKYTRLTGQCGHQAEELFSHFGPFPRDFVGTFLVCGLHSLQTKTKDSNININTCCEKRVKIKIPPTTLPVGSNSRGNEAWF
jgi:hypothetical protein